MKVVIPAGGAATRFRPLSLVVPKHFLPLGGRPLIHHAVAEVAEAGFSGAVIVVAPGGRAGLETYFAAAGVGLGIEYVEQPSPLGIGDAVLRAAPLAGERFGVLLPDDVEVRACRFAGEIFDCGTPESYEESCARWWAAGHL